jgi:hypothetical protein
VERQPLKKLAGRAGFWLARWLRARGIRQIEKARLEQLKQAPKARPNLMVLVLMRVIGIDIETVDMLVKEILSRSLRDRRAVARYEGLTGSPDESGKKPREGACQIRQRTSGSFTPTERARRKSAIASSRLPTLQRSSPWCRAS